MNNGLIIIYEPLEDAKFGDPKLNKKGLDRDKKMLDINNIRNELTNYLKTNDKIRVPLFKDLVKSDGKKYNYILVIKKIL